jgi:succinoglycan biosynthesis transport protein ExoP
MNAQAPVFDPALVGDDGQSSLVEKLGALRRRLRPMLIAFGTTLALTLLIAFLWPPTYTSNGIVLIEQQEVPEEFVHAAVTSYADQRVKMISQRVMTTANLLEIIRKYGLYPDRQRTEPREKLLKRMRDDIGLEMISADVVDPLQGKATKATIAFSVSFDSRSPVEAARVANELTTLYLNENLETRKQLAADTAQFLKQESERVGKEVADLDQRIATFKSEHGDALPELSQVNLQMITRAEEELRSVEARITTLDQQAVYLGAQLAQVSPSSMAFTATGERVLTSQDRLKVLRTQLASATSLYGPDHPDVQRLRRESAGLEKEVGAQNAGNDLVRQLADAKAQLAQARNRYSAEHPDVIRLQHLVDAITDAMRQSSQTAATMASSANPDNPAYIQLTAQREAVTTERGGLVRQREQLRARIADVESRLASAPGVEREYSALMRDLQGAQFKYQEVRQKQMAAQLSQNLETEQKGERFTLIEPPLVPEQPASPNRPLILVFGLLLSLGAGFGIAVLLEAVDGRVRGRRDLTNLVGVVPLAVVPWIEIDEDRLARRKQRRRLLAALVAGLLVLALLVNYLYRPLDVIWQVLMRRLGI